MSPVRPRGTRSWLALGVALACLLGLLALLLLLIPTVGTVPNQPPQAVGDSTHTTELGGSVSRPVAELGVQEDSRPLKSNDSPAPVAAGIPVGVIDQEDSPFTVIGRVLDERTDEPVPDLSVALSCGSVLEIVPTRDDGSFSSRKHFPRGTLAASIRDLDLEIARPEREFDPEAAQGEWVLHVRIGPTYPLELEDGSPLALESCVVRLVESARPLGMAGVIVVRGDGLSGEATLEGIPDREWPWQKLRRGRLPWIRYSTVLWLPDQQMTPHLEVELAASGIQAVGSVRSTVGVQPPTRIESITACSELSGEIVLPSDPPVSHFGESGACVLLLPSSEKPRDLDHTPMWHEAWPSSSGSFSFRRVRPGSWRLLAYASDHQVVEQRIELPSGPTKLGAIRLPRCSEDGVVELLATESTSHPLGRILVRLRLSAAGGLARAWLQTLSNSGNTGTSYFNLPAADFDVSEIALFGAPSFRPFETRITAPCQLTELQRVRVEEQSAVVLDVRKANTSAPLQSYEVFLGPRGSVFGQPDPGDTGQWSIVKDAPLQWSVWSEGCAPTFGDESTLMETTEGRVARVVMNPGWGASLLFRAANPATFTSQKWPWGRWEPAASSLLGSLACPPLAGVRVRVGSDPIAVSDKEGEAHITLRDRPSRLVLQCDGWKLLGVEPVLFRRSGISNVNIVWMDRE